MAAENGLHGGQRTDPVAPPSGTTVASSHRPPVRTPSVFRHQKDDLQVDQTGVHHLFSPATCVDAFNVLDPARFAAARRPRQQPVRPPFSIGQRQRAVRCTILHCTTQPI